MSFKQTGIAVAWSILALAFSAQEARAAAVAPTGQLDLTLDVVGYPTANLQALFAASDILESVQLFKIGTSGPITYFFSRSKDDGKSWAQVYNNLDNGKYMFRLTGAVGTSVSMGYNFGVGTNTGGGSDSGTITAVPEPEALALAAFGAAVAVAVKRRRARVA